MNADENYECIYYAMRNYYKDIGRKERRLIVIKIMEV